MKRLATFLVSLALVIISGVGTTQVSAATAPECDISGAYTLAEVAEGVTPCPGADISVLLAGNTASLEVPPPGVFLTGLLASASQSPIDAFLVFQVPQGLVGVEVGGMEYGAALQASGQQASGISALAVTPGCGLNNYTLLPAHWNKTYSWKYNSSGQSGTSALSAIQEGVGRWTAGTNRCTGTTYTSNFVSAYTGTTTLTPSPGANSSCAGADGSNVIGWKPLGTLVLALTCVYSASPSTVNIAGEADVAFNTQFYFYSGSSISGCPAGYADLRQIAGHEAGHIVGLGHTLDAYSQLMKVNFDACETNQRLLAPGDINGLHVWY